MTEEDRKAKVIYINSYFDDLRQKIAFLDELYRSKHKDEASLLCCCYIEGLGNHIYWPGGKSWENFVLILSEHGGNEIFKHILPLHLKRVLEDPVNSTFMINIGKKIRNTLISAKKELLSKEETIDLIKPILEELELSKLRPKLWKGTFASIAYEHFRGPYVHSLTASDISFSKTTFRGEPVPNLDFGLLYEPLLLIFEEAKKISVDSNKWFGHDYKV